MVQVCVCLVKYSIFLWNRILSALENCFFLSTIKREKIGSSSFFKIGCVVVTLNLFPRLNMFDPYNLSEEQYQVLSEQLMMKQQVPRNSVSEEKHWIFFLIPSSSRLGLANKLFKSSRTHIFCLLQKFDLYLSKHSTMESALTVFNILSVLCLGSVIQKTKFCSFFG